MKRLINKNEEGGFFGTFFKRYLFQREILKTGIKKSEGNSNYKIAKGGGVECINIIS